MADSSISIRMLRLPDVMAITGLSRAAIYAKCKAVELNLLCVKRMYCFVGDVPPDEAAEQI